MTELQPFKEQIGPALVADLAARILAVEPTFAAAAFRERLARELPPLELKARVAAVADALRDYLPDHYPEALKVILAILGPAPAESPGMFKDSWYAWPLAAFVERHGLEHPDESLAALHAITQRSSAEFAIRPLLIRHPKRTMAALRSWAHDPNFHVRRLVSEGTRTRLPWAGRLPAFIADPTPVLDLLELLRADPSEYVRRSVANNLNDISKDHPELALSTLERWAADDNPAMRRLISHAARSLVKQGHPRALALLGANGVPPKLEAIAVEPERPRIGESLAINARIVGAGEGPQRLVVDYVMYFAGARGGLRRKVFKLRALELGPGERADLRWRHSLEQRSVRRHYPGPHRVELQVNGAILGGADFELLE